MEAFTDQFQGVVEVGDVLLSHGEEMAKVAFVEEVDQLVDKTLGGLFKLVYL